MVACALQKAGKMTEFAHKCEKYLSLLWSLFLGDDTCRSDIHCRHFGPYLESIDGRPKELRNINTGYTFMASSHRNRSINAPKEPKFI
jgi:hypothetical protein